MPSAVYTACWRLCHEEFKYARQALRLGVLDYLVKDALTENILYNALNDALSCAESEKGVGVTPDSPVRGFDYEDDTPADFVLKTSNLKNKEYFCCAIKPICRPSGNYVNIINEINAILYSLDGGSSEFLENGVFFVLAAIPSSPSAMNAFNNRFNILLQIRTVLEGFMGCPITIGVSGYGKKPEDFETLKDEAMQALDLRVFHGKGKTLYYDRTSNKSTSIQIDIVNLKFNRIKAAVENSDLAQLEQELSNLYQKDLTGITQYNYLQHINALLMGLLTTFCTAENIPFERVFKSSTVSLDEINKLETIQEMHLWSSECFKLLVCEIKELKETYSSRIKRVTYYIQKNYADNIELDDIAETFGLHKVYLAKIFKEETGESIAEFIRKLRMEKAKELLRDKDIPVSDIVYMTGFKNPQNFYSVFKRFVGVSPREYREALIR